MTKHIPAEFMVKLYTNLLLRFALYSAYGYAVSLAFSFIYYTVISPQSGVTWGSACPLSPYSAIAYLSVVGYFAARDAIETNSSPLAGLLKTLPTRV